MAEANGDVCLPAEATVEELEARHERENDELEEKAKRHLESTKSGNKGKKVKAALEAAEREVEQWRYDLHLRQSEELERLQEHLLEGVTGNGRRKSGCETKVEEQCFPSAAQDDEAARVERKKEKSLRKKQNRAAREAEHEAAKEHERRAAGPSAREVELAQLAALLQRCSPPLRVLEVAADGHCLYHSVGDQIQRVRPDLYKWRRARGQMHEEVRWICATSLRKRAEDYAPFAELKDGEDFEGYCKRIEHSADWGGELELRALADELGVQILVHRAAESEPLVLGQKHDKGSPLQVAYHRHYYALGEHYNSVVPVTV